MDICILKTSFFDLWLKLKLWIALLPAGTRFKEAKQGGRILCYSSICWRHRGCCTLRQPCMSWGVNGAEPWKFRSRFTARLGARQQLWRKGWQCLRRVAGELNCLADRLLKRGRKLCGFSAAKAPHKNGLFISLFKVNLHQLAVIDATWTYSRKCSIDRFQSVWIFTKHDSWGNPYDFSERLIHLMYLFLFLNKNKGKGNSLKFTFKVQPLRLKSFFDELQNS